MFTSITGKSSIDARIAYQAEGIRRLLDNQKNFNQKHRDLLRILQDRKWSCDRFSIYLNNQLTALRAKAAAGAPPAQVRLELAKLAREGEELDKEYKYLAMDTRACKEGVKYSEQLSERYEGEVGEVRSICQSRGVDSAEMLRPEQDFES